MKRSKNLKISFFLALFLFSFNVFSDTIVCCNTDTLTLAYEYDDILYYDSCDIQLNDVLVISSDCEVFIQILPIDTSFNFWLSRYEPHVCPQIPCEFDNYITKVSEDGIYRAYEYINKKYQTYFEVIKGDSDDLQFLVLPEQGNPPVYNVSINNDFEYYSWSEGSTSYYSLIDQPGNYTINATNHCGQIFENNIDISASGFVEDQFYTNQQTGDNVNYIDLVPDSTAHFFHGGSVPPYKDFLFDINQDEINDIYFDVDFASALGAYYGSFLVTPLNGCELLTINFPFVPMNIDENSVINNIFSFSGEGSTIMYKEGWSGFTAGCIAGLWQDSDNYLGFRIPVNNDTLYGWMHISFFTSWGEMNLIIDDYAYISSSSNGINKNKDENITVYPNPFSDNFQIITELQDYSISVMSITGKTVYLSEQNNGNNKIHLPNLNNGIYFLVIEWQGIKQTQKVIKK